MHQLTANEIKLIEAGLKLYGTMPANRMFRVINQVVGNLRYRISIKYQIVDGLMFEVPIRPRKHEKGMTQAELTIYRMVKIYNKSEGRTVEWKDRIDRTWREKDRDKAASGLSLVTTYAGFDDDTPWGIILDKLKEDGIISIEHEYVDLYEAL